MQKMRFYVAKINLWHQKRTLEFNLPCNSTIFPRIIIVMSNYYDTNKNFYFTAGYDVMESGDRLEKVTNDNILFMPNHQSTADVPLCMTLFTARANFADRVMWIMDRIFKYSNFGCVSWMHDDFFILAVSYNFYVV